MNFQVVFCTILLETFALGRSENLNPAKNEIILTPFDSPLFRDPKINPDLSKAPNKIQPRAFSAARDTVFYLYTKKNPDVGQVIGMNVDVLKNSNWDKTEKTRFIFHGFLGDSKSNVNTAVRQALLQLGNYNVVVVDWGKGAQTPNYFAAKDRIYQVGDVSAKFIDFLHENGFLTSFEMINLIGHSLGAHLAGAVGKKVTRGKIQAIFGLDPAGPLFEDSDPTKRLSATDAVYVEALHTNPGLLGISKPIGQIDFYANVGSTQPGCIFDIIGACSHIRATGLYAESLNSQLFIANSCKNYFAYLLDACTGSKLVMGGDSSKTGSGIYLFKTNSKSPFAKG